MSGKIQNDKKDIAKGAVLIFKIMMKSDRTHHRAWALAAIQLQTYY